jgi:hypothetical protein
VNQPKFAAGGKIKKADDEVAGNQISETLKSIEVDLNKGRLDADEKTHPFHRITAEDSDNVECVREGERGLEDLSTESLGNLLVARLKAQGYLIYFDEKVIAETLEKARARLGGFLDHP